MKISIKSDYALRAMFELSLRGGEGAVGTNQIASKQRVPKRYLEHLLLMLKKAGLVGSFRGKEGGYTLIKNASEISVADIVRAVEGDLDLLPKRSRKASKADVTYSVWLDAQKAFENTLADITLESLAEKKKRADSVPVYSI